MSKIQGTIKTYLKNKRLDIAVHSKLSLENFKKLTKEGFYKINTSLKIKKLNSFLIKEQILNIRDIIKKTEEESFKKISLKIGIERAFNFPQKQILKLCQQVSKINSIDRIGLSDTDGSVTPQKLLKLLKKLDENIDANIEIELHLHNDY